MKKFVMIGTTAACFYGFRSELIKNLNSKNITVYAFTTDNDALELEKISKLGAIPISYQLNRGGLNPLADMFATYKLAQKINQLKPDLVFSYFSKPVIFGTLAAKIAKVPKIIGMLEGLGYTFTDQPNGLSPKTKIIKAIQIFLYKLALPKLDQLILLNHDDKTDLLINNDIAVKETYILGGIGLDLNQYKYSPATKDLPIQFLFIGRLLKEKGIHDFIAAAQIVKEKFPQTTFTVLGGIDEANLGALTQGELTQYIDNNVIDYPGHVENIAEWIKQSHVFVLPSYREGVPRSTQEAMAIGRPVITTDVPGCRDTVIDGVNGFLVPKWDPQALAEKMIYFIEHPEQVRMMGDQSHKIAIEKFDAEKVNQRLLQILGI
ncbi:glycosyltransferase family 4 protein [Acinetobacter towneri]|uniref:glycosyltransferase family 4 protein n=1 Tax=Acinetobacter towneri TaxID=202956 RepID=UPI002B262015|nr:glycosyltransferase family 4 protein [Acinetobacter towneri]WPC32137.1 glycosyltransferase family 4 protein [Acinetobacter towneri]